MMLLLLRYTKKQKSMSNIVPPVIRKLNGFLSYAKLRSTAEVN